MRIAFLVEKFPAVSEPFIIDQVEGLVQRGVNVEIFSLQPADTKNVSEKFDHDMAGRTFSMNVPSNPALRFLSAIPKAVTLLFAHPKVLMRALNVSAYGRDATSLRLIFWSSALVGKKFDLYHCHGGVMGNKFLVLRKVLGLKEKFITTFYGYDVSRYFREEGPNVYDKLEKECSQFFTMSAATKERLVRDRGFDAASIAVHPIGVELPESFEERTFSGNRPFRILSVGRLVEKKGFDDLLRALAIVREQYAKPFMCTIVGDGPLRKTLRELATSLRLDDVLDFKGAMRIQDIVPLLESSDFFVQPSKTTADGNME